MPRLDLQQVIQHVASVANEACQATTARTCLLEYVPLHTLSDTDLISHTESLLGIQIGITLAAIYASAGKLPSLSTPLIVDLGTEPHQLTLPHTAPAFLETLLESSSLHRTCKMPLGS